MIHATAGDVNRACARALQEIGGVRNAARREEDKHWSVERIKQWWFFDPGSLKLTGEITAITL